MARTINVNAVNNLRDEFMFSQFAETGKAAEAIFHAIIELARQVAIMNDSRQGEHNAD